MPGDTRSRDDVINLVNESFLFIDAKDFDGYRRLMADEVEVDFGGINENGEAEPAAGTVPADVLVANVVELIGPVGATQHMISSHVVAFNGNEATVNFYEQALQYHPALGDDVAVNTWVLFGRAEYRLRHTPEGWKIVGTRLRRVYDTGNVNLLADVAKSLQ